MRFGIFIPPFGPCADVATLATLASEAEEAGWDGFFLWDDVTINIPLPVADPWVALSAIALRTRTLRLGALVTPLPRRRPWKVARETVTLDHLSQGRLIVGVGLGGDPAEFDDLGEEADLKVRAPCWARDWTSSPASGVASPSSMRGSTTISAARSFCHAHSSRLAFLCGWAGRGPPKPLFGGPPASMVSFRWGVICP